MLTLTDNASTLLKNVAAAQGVETAGLRISAEGADAQSLAVTAAEQPEPGDQVVEQDGATVYLDVPAAEQLDDKLLDAGVDDTGNIQFSLSMQH